MAWVKYTCGRLKSDYRYSKDLVYNNYPFPKNISEKNRLQVEEKAQNLEGNLISVATDGEIYGHHEAFGDMCLASFFKKVESSESLELCNWSKYLDENPPQWEVKLIKGEDHRGSSWSCHHGVSRWYKDCGCSTGAKEGWNQKWRGPLRTGLTKLNKELKKIYIKQVSSTLKIDPLELRNNYGQVLCGAISREAFIEKILPEKQDPLSVSRLLRLLEGQKYSQFMLTSCGWFFSELSGIEPIQNLKFVARAIELYSDYTKKNLYQMLSHYLMKSKSNIPEKGNGWELFKEEALTESHHITKTVAQFLYQEIFNVKKRSSKGNYHFHNLIIVVAT
jgi:hypothetical protein